MVMARPLTKKIRASGAWTRHSGRAFDLLRSFHLGVEGQVVDFAQVGMSYRFGWARTSHAGTLRAGYGGTGTRVQSNRTHATAGVAVGAAASAVICAQWGGVKPSG